MDVLVRVMLVAGFVAIVLCVVLDVVLMRRLQRNLPQAYAAMGSPRTFGLGPSHWGNAMYLRFLLLRGHRALGDAGVSRLADAQLALLVMAVVALLGLFTLVAIYR